MALYSFGADIGVFGYGLFAGIAYVIVLLAIAPDNAIDQGSHCAEFIRQYVNDRCKAFYLT